MLYIYFFLTPLLLDIKMSVLSTFSTETLIKDNTFAHVFFIWQQQTLSPYTFASGRNLLCPSPPCKKTF